MKTAFFALCSAALAAGASLVPRDVLNHGQKPLAYRGFDISSVLVEERKNVTFINSRKNNRTEPIEDILGAKGTNTYRLRLWVDPVDPTYQGYGLDYNIELASRLHKKGYKIYLDYHFSHTWADPQKQFIPPAWEGLSLTDTAKTIRSYVSTTLLAFHRAKIPIEIASLGNEIRNGMLWPLARAYPFLDTRQERVQNFTNLATVWAGARRGVDDAVSAGARRPQTMIHVDNGYNKTLQLNWYDALFGTGLVKPSDVDIFGVSFYPFYGLNATLDNLLDTANAVTGKYKKPFHVVETDWPVICEGVDLSEPRFPVSARGQTEWVQAIIDVLQKVKGGWGQGINFWEPGFVDVTSLGSNCTDALAFNVDWSGWPNTIKAYSRESVDMFANKR
ncbi:putative glycosyl hydrolase family 53 protein 3 [Elsinoe fawcettii]|nr:putative glycosyl hydrolase family 53 protein 3 [Elsinoe fawcettii]